VHVAVT